MGMRTTNNQSLPEFDAIRRRAQQKQLADTQRAQENLQRNFARFGGTNTGAFIKSQRVLEDEMNQRGDEIGDQINQQELAEKRRLNEVEQARQFARSEREASQEFANKQQQGQFAFARGEREAGQAFGRGEREATQKFASEQQQGQYAFARGEREAGQAFQEKMSDRDLAFRDKVFNVEKDAKLRQLALAEQEFAMDQKTTEFNKFISLLGLNNHGQIVSGLRSMIEDPSTTPAARTAAYQYLGGLNDVYLSKDQVRRIGSGQLSRENAIKENFSLR